jgi:hypothetical protein
MNLSRVLVLLTATAIAGCSSTSSPTTNDQGDQTLPTDAPIDLPTAAPAPHFAVIKLSGRGDKVAKFKIPADVAAIATFTNAGDSNFSVESLDSSGQTNDLLVNVIGRYSGTVLFDADASQHSVAFKIGSNGAWTATIKPVSGARAWNGTAKLAGKGDDVVRVNPPISGLATATFTHSGSENFAVVSYSADSSDLLINEIGHYHGQVQLPDGTQLLAVSADGAWTATPD